MSHLRIGLLILFALLAVGFTRTIPGGVVKVNVRDTCSASSGDALACETAEIVRSIAEWEACSINNERMCIVDSEITCSLTNGDPLCFDPTYSAIKYNTTTYFTDRGCLIADNSTGTELTATAVGIKPNPDAVLTDSVFRFVNLCVEERRLGVRIGHTVLASGLVTTGGTTTITDSGASFGSITGEAVVVRVGEDAQEIRVIGFNTGTILFPDDNFSTTVATNDTYEVWAYGTFRAMDWNYTDTAVPIRLEVVNPTITIYAIDSTSYAIGQETAGCTNTVIQGGKIQAPIAVSMTGDCAGYVGTTGTTSAINVTNDTIDFTSAHSFETGDVVEVDAANFGLYTINPYYVIDVDSDTIALAYTKHDVGRTWSTAVTWDVDITGTHSTTVVTLVEQSTLLVNDLFVNANHLTSLPMVSALTGNMFAEISNVHSEYGGFSGDTGSTYTLMQLAVRDSTVNRPRSSVYRNFGNGQNQFICRGLKVVGWGVSRRLVDATDDLIRMKDGVWADCEFELLGGMNVGSQSVFESVGDFSSLGGRALRFKVQTPAGMEYPDATVQSISHSTPSGSRGALITTGGSNQVSALVDTSFSSIGQGYGPVGDGSQIWCVEDGTIVDGDTCCAYRDGLACEAVLDVTNGGLDNCANNQTAGESFLASCYHPIELPIGW